MELSNVNKRDIVSKLALGTAGVVFAQHVMPTSNWNTTLLCSGVLLGTGAAFAVETRFGGRHASAITCGGLAAVIMGYAANELMGQPHKMLTAWGEGDLWSAIAGVRRLSVATGMVIPVAWRCWNVSTGLLQDKAEARDTQYFAGSIRNMRSLFQTYTDDQINIWMMSPDLQYQAQLVAHLQFEGHAVGTFAGARKFLDIPVDITERFGRMSSAQIRDLILRTTNDQLNIGRVQEVLRQQNRMHIVDELIASGGKFADADYEKFKQEVKELGASQESNEVKQAKLEELNQRLSNWKMAYPLARDVARRFEGSDGLGSVTRAVAKWRDFAGEDGKDLSAISLSLENMRFVREDENEDEDAVAVLMMHMIMEDFDKWKAALGIGDLAGMEEKLTELGLVKKSDLERAGIYFTESNAGQILVTLKAYRETFEEGQKEQTGGVQAALLNYLATPSTLKEAMGPAGRKALKVIGALGYVGVWALCTVAHYKHHKGWFIAGMMVASLERILLWKFLGKTELRSRDMGDLPLAVGAPMFGEEMQAAWLAGNDVQQVLQQVLHGDDSIRRDLYERAMTFGERGPVAQARVLASETGLSSLYSTANWVGTPWYLRRNGVEFGAGTVVVGRSFTHMMCDTAVGFFKRGKRYVSTWPHFAVVGENAE